MASSKVEQKKLTAKQAEIGALEAELEEQEQEHEEGARRLSEATRRWNAMTPGSEGYSDVKEERREAYRQATDAEAAANATRLRLDGLRAEARELDAKREQAAAAEEGGS
jgi:hypothetical protein